MAKLCRVGCTISPDKILLVHVGESTKSPNRYARSVTVDTRMTLVDPSVYGLGFRAPWFCRASALTSGKNLLHQLKACFFCTIWVVHVDTGYQTNINKLYSTNCSRIQIRTIGSLAPHRCPSPASPRESPATLRHSSKFWFGDPPGKEAGFAWGIDLPPCDS